MDKGWGAPRLKNKLTKIPSRKTHLLWCNVDLNKMPQPKKVLLFGPWLITIGYTCATLLGVRPQQHSFELFSTKGRSIKRRIVGAQVGTICPAREKLAAGDPVHYL